MKHTVFLLTLIVTLSCSLSAQVVTSPEKTPAVRSVPDSVVDRMKKDKEFAYANDMSYWKKAPPRRRSSFDRLMSLLTQSAAVKIVLYSLLVAGILYGLYQVMVVNNFFIFSGGRRRNADEESGDALVNENLDEKINEAVTDKNYRQAIRFMYLKTLKLLNDNHVITLHARSTNQDYIRQMYKHDALPQFRQLTHIYEYVWYGDFDPTEAQFEIISANFNRFNRNN